MTWQDPGTNPASGGPGGSSGPDDDATRSDWDLAQLDALVGDGGGGPGNAPPQGPPAAPAPAPALGYGAPAAPPPAPGYGAPAPAPGYGPAPGYAPGMTWEPPTPHGGSGGPGGGFAFAGTPARFVAWVIDGLILGLVSAPIGLVLNNLILGGIDLGTLMNPMAFANQEATGRLLAYAAATVVIGTAIEVAYFVLQWTGGARATLGMRLFRLQIGNASDGRTLTRRQALRRWVAMGTWVSLIGIIPALDWLTSLGLLIWFIVLLVTTAGSPTRQGLHDRFAASAIVAPADGSGSGMVVGCVTVIVIVAALAIASIVALALLGAQVETILSTVGESI